MRVFVVVSQPTEKPVELANVIATQFPGEQARLLRPGVWLVAANGSSDDVARQLDVLPNAVNGGAVVIAMEGYAGHAPITLWDWIKGRLALPAAPAAATSASTPVTPAGPVTPVTPAAPQTPIAPLPSGTNE